MKLHYVNPARRDLLAQLGALGASLSLLPAAACAQSNSGRGATFGQAPIWNGAPGYESHRRAMLAKANTPARYPDVIVTAASDAEVVQALDFARQNDLKVVCRTSGHNTAGAVMRDGGMLLDLSPMNRITIDEAVRQVTVQPAALFGEFMEVVKASGFDFPHGDCDTVALCGYLLGGGLGKNDKHYTGGPACYAIERAEIILADGRKVIADAQQNQKLLWAIKGCGPGFFGVITSLSLRVFPPVGTKLSSSYTFPASDITWMLDQLGEVADRMDDRVHIGVGLAANPDDSTSALARVSITAYALAGADPEGDARSLLTAHTPEGLKDRAVEKEEYVAADLDSPLIRYPPGMCTNTDNGYVDDPYVFASFVDWFLRAPHGARTSLGLSYEALPRTFSEDACYSPGGRHMISYHLNWMEAQLPDVDAFYAEADDWMGEFDTLLRPHAKGHFISQVDNGRFPDRIENAFSAANWTRLMTVKRRYDPEARFFSYLGHA